MGTHYQGNHWITGQKLDIQVDHGTVITCEPSSHDSNHWIAPGLIDVQLNGIGGFDLNGLDTTVQTVKDVVRVLHEGGVTRFCPTIVTGTKERILHCVRTIAEACESDPLVNYAVIGIHVEGPFISSVEGPRGAHNEDWVRDPDWNEFLEWYEASHGRICKVTLAPEKPGAIELISKLTQLGIVAAIGHCNASEEDIQKAVDAGATMSTHLGNGAHPVIKRHPNYIWSQLAEDRLWAGLIADGHHLPMSTLKVMLRAKGRKAIITSDAVSLAGMPPGSYETHINSAVVLEPNGFLHLARTPDILAGSATPLYKALENMAQQGVSSIGEAITMATLHPAELFGLDTQGVGRIEAGSPADFIIYNYSEEHGLIIHRTISNGEVVYER